MVHVFGNFTVKVVFGRTVWAMAAHFGDTLGVRPAETTSPLPAHPQPQEVGGPLLL